MLGKVIKGIKKALTGKIVVKGYGYSSKSTMLDDISITQIKYILKSENFHQTMKLYKTMLKRDWQISGDLGERKIKIIGSKYKIEGGDVNLRKFIDSYFKELKLTSLLADINSGIDYGFSIIDLVYENKNLNGTTYFLPTKFNFITQVIVQRDDKRGLFIQDSSLTKHFLDELPYKLLFHTHKMDSGDILDYSILSKLIWIFTIKHFMISQSMSYAEMLGVPPIVVNSKATDKETIMQMFEQVLELRSGSAGVFGENDKVSLVEGKANGELFMKFIRYADSAITHTILGGTMSGSDSTSGSYARDNVHNEVKQAYHKADMALISETINDLIKKACDLNFTNIKEYPIFSFIYETSSTTNTNVKEDNSTNFLQTNSKEYNSKTKPKDKIDIQMKNLNTKDIEEETLQNIESIIENADSYQEALTILSEEYENIGDEKLEDMVSNYIYNSTIQGDLDEQENKS